MAWTRREWLRGMGIALGGTFGCATPGSATNGSPDLASGPDLPPGADLGPPRLPTDAPPHALDCSGAGNLSAEQLLAPIDHFVVLCMENRSFDHYLGSLRLEGWTIDGLTGAESNPDPNGVPVSVFKQNNLDPNLPHSWQGSRDQWNSGGNDGFARGGGAADAMGYHTRDQLQTLYALADRSAVCDRWFSSVMGPTWPNRQFLHGATSCGKMKNEPILFGYKSIFAQLTEAGISNANYFHDLPWATGAYLKLDGFLKIEKFFEDAAAGTLPSFSIIDPQYMGAGQNDSYPETNPLFGQALIASVFNALSQGPLWSKTLFILTFDEHGGFYDHVAPPTTVDERPEFRQLGFRVPAMVAGPHVRKGCAVSTPFEHVSIISTLTKRFGLTPLNQRVSAANDLSSCIDPGLVDLPQPPFSLPPVDLTGVHLDLRPSPVDAHPELAEAVRRGFYPPHLDRRAESDQIFARVLAQGERLGAVRR